ncbi:MAG: hypothetical protein EZS28_033932, partial [Streblomastix strix]
VKLGLAMKKTDQKRIVVKVCAHLARKERKNATKTTELLVMEHYERWRAMKMEIMVSVLDGVMIVFVAVVVVSQCLNLKNLKLFVYVEMKMMIDARFMMVFLMISWNLNVGVVRQMNYCLIMEILGSFIL